MVPREPEGNFCFPPQPTNHPTNQPINQPTNQPKNQLTNQPPNKQTNKQPIYQPTNEPTNQPTKKPTNQPINQRTNQSCEWNAKSLNRERELRPRIGSDATFFWDSCSNLEIDDNFRISHNLGLGLAANISTALVIQLDC